MYRCQCNRVCLCTLQCIGVCANVNSACMEYVPLYVYIVCMLCVCVLVCGGMVDNQIAHADCAIFSSTAPCGKRCARDRDSL